MNEKNIVREINHDIWRNSNWVYVKLQTLLEDFINKFQIALKECYETDYWLDLFKETHIITDDEYKIMFAKCSKIRKLLVASITTAKGKS